MKKLMIGIFASLFLASCGTSADSPDDSAKKENPKLTSESYKIKWSVPPHPGSNSFSMELKKCEDATNFAVEPFMPSMNHGSYSEFLEVKKQGSTLTVEGLNFNMPGDWTVEVSFDCSNKRVAHKEAVFVTKEQNETKQFNEDVRLNWLVGPKPGNNSFEVSTKEGYKLVKVTPFMPSMGHGSYSENLQIEKSGSEKHLVTGLYLSMPGVWEIRLSFEKGEQKINHVVVVKAQP